MLLWENGIVAIAPHLNSGAFADHRKEEPRSYKNGHKELVRRVDALLELFVSKRAPGAVDERELAQQLGKPVFKDVKACLKWGVDNGT